jgi:hypothetical protein
MLAPVARLSARSAAVGSLMIALSVGGSIARATDFVPARVKQGARIFRAMLSSDLDLDTKAEGDGTLVVLVYHNGRSDLAQLATEVIAAEGKELSPGHHVRVQEVASLGAIGPRPAALFLADELSRDALEALVRWSLEKKVFIFSPYEGHVERGVAGGVLVGARVQPYLNKGAMQRTGLRFSQLVMQVSKVHEGSP